MAGMGERGPEARLLVVEDEPNILELLSASLRLAGFEVATATGGPEDQPAAMRTLALVPDARAAPWVAAAVGSNSAAGVQLATGEPVVAIGGFNGSDPAPTLEQFQRCVAEARIHRFLGGGRMGGSMGGSDDAGQIAAWVAERYTPASVGGAVVYDLS
jgi:response regulator RpfG family c-di-GMP phosphodiesterase